MKTILLIAGACCIQLYTVWAQPTHPIRVKTESEASKAIPAHDKYRYATFSQGSVSYINGQVATARLNYNLLLGEMQFIDPKGDTLSVANEYTLALITIGKDLFYYDSHHGCLEVIADYTSVKLARQYLLK